MTQQRNLGKVYTNMEKPLVLKGIKGMQIADSLVSYGQLVQEYQKLQAIEEVSIAGIVKDKTPDELRVYTELQKQDQQRKQAQKELDKVIHLKNQAVKQGRIIDQEIEQKIIEQKQKIDKIENDLASLGFQSLEGLTQIAQALKFDEDMLKNKQFLMTQINELRSNIIQDTCLLFGIDIDSISLEEAKEIFKKLQIDNNLDSIPFFITKT